MPTRTIPALGALLLASIFAVVSGCATAPNASTAVSAFIPNPGTASTLPTRVDVGGVAVLAPPGTDWQLAHLKHRSVVYSRASAREGNRWRAWVQVVEWAEPIEGYFQLSRFVAFLTESEAAKGETRTRDLLEPVSTARATCLRRVMHSSGAPAASAQRSVDYFCRHPLEARSIVHVHVSQADALGSVLGDVDSIALKFFSSIAFNASVQ
jgi:hypothetical protein